MDQEKPERIYPPHHFEAGDDLPEDYRQKVITLLRRTNEIGSARPCQEAMLRIRGIVDFASDQTTRVRLTEFYADEWRHQYIFDSVAQSMGIKIDDDFVHGTDALNSYDDLQSIADFALSTHFLDRAGGMQLFDYESSSFAPLARAGMQVARDEMGHCALGYQLLREICVSDEGRAKVMARLPKWYGFALDMFGVSTGRRQYEFIRYGLKTKTNDELRSDYIEHVTPYMDPLGIELPGPMEVPRVYV